QGTAPNAAAPLGTPPAGEANQPVTAAPDLSSPLETTTPADLSPPSEPAPPAVPETPDNTIAANDSTEDGASIGSAGPQLEERVTIETELLTVVFTNAGGDVVSWKLKMHDDKDDKVEMVLSGTKEARAFTVAFGGLNAQPLTSLFYVNRVGEYTVEFYRDFIIPNTGSRFRLTKRYDLKPKDYMFELAVTLDGGHNVPGFNFGGSAYTLSFGPQMGPRFEKLDGRYDYREYITYTNGKRKKEKVNDSNPIIISSNPKWAAISGKYFSCIAIPLLAQYEINFSEKSEVGVSSTSRLNIIRPPLNSPRATDTYRFYLGPKSQDVLNAYNTGNNGFGSIEMQLTEVANTKGILSPLEKLLKWLLLMFYKLTPNYGVAIILLTLLVKILFFPLTKKGSEATLRMQAVAPKIKELQEKYKDNRQKMNTEMAELYKKEGYNPLSGCLPLLLQFPIFIAMYNLFNNHFDLRGAMFIPGWIPDLSLPESIWNFPEGVRLPILGWNALRLLPFIYVGSQLLYGKVTQTPDQQANAQMKMMLYVMPIVFFFILYDVPSGLLVYWIFSNLLTMVQQMAINKYLAPRRAAAAAAAAAQAASAAAASPKKKKK
ncbi:MAG: membrane protein insertase YidC, partial [Treponema sp.]|nr:membrane protein insertase YidC [Treponema sp.]